MPQKYPHEFYVYHEGSVVYARMRTRERVVVKECASPQEAYDFVQAVVNPEGHPASHYGEMGYLSEEFLSKVSENCRSVVEAAYAAAGQ